MNLIVEKINELNDLISNFKNKNYTAEEAYIIISASNAARKWASLVIQAHAVESKNKRTVKYLERMNVMDDSTAIDVTPLDEEMDKIKCPCHENLIMRSECLDYSGSHYEDCAGCETGISTKEKLLPVK